MKVIIFLLFIFGFSTTFAQNSLVGDGFGGRLWYKPYNYTVGSYSGHTVCGQEASLYSWGYGPMGDTTTTPPANGIYKALGIDSVVYYTTGYVMAAITADSAGWFWDGIYSTYKPLPSKLISNVHFVDAGYDKVSFVKYDGTVWTLGNNFNGEFGNNATNNFFDTLPKQMSNMTNAVRTAVSGSSILVLTATGEVYTCGMRNNTVADIDSIPYLVPILQNIVDIKALSSSYAALDASGNVWTWGSGAMGSLGNGIDSVLITPSKIDTLENIIAISGSCDGYHFLALDKDSNCYGWGGFNSYGTIGNNDNLDVYYPVKVADHVADIMAGETFSYIVKTDGSLWATGTSNVVSIWLNLLDTSRYVFTKLDPTFAPFNLCSPVIFINNTIEAPDSICAGNCVNYNLSNSQAYTNFTWSFPGANTSTSSLASPTNICYNTAGTYTASVIISGTAGIDTLYKTIVVSALPNAVITGKDTICNGETTTLSTTNAAGSFVWSTSELTNSISISPNTNTTYSLVVYNKTCIDTAKKPITIVPYPIANISGVNYFTCKDGPITLSSINNANQYTWSTGQTSNSISVSPTVPTTYVLTLSNVLCTDVDSFFIDVEPNCNLIFPNAYSPNGIAANEVFLPVNGKQFVLENYELFVFNRFGQQIFSTKNVAEGWSCPKCDIGIYYYLCNYKLQDRAKQTVSGDITLIK